MARRDIVLEVIARVAGVDPGQISPASELVADLGIDSSKALAVLVELEDRLEIEIDDESVARLNTVDDVVQAIG